MGPLSVTCLCKGQTENGPKEIILNASKEHICHHRELDVTVGEKKVSGKQIPVRRYCVVQKLKFWFKEQ